jgi:uncharacterized protein (TIGR02594 family)
MSKIMEALDKIRDIAKGEIGVREVPGAPDTPRILEYHDCTSLDACDDETPWCSSFVNWVIKQAGFKGTGSAAARSWLSWGVPADKPVRGCVVILKRGAPPSGHVAIYDGDNGALVVCIGGNQGDAVKFSSFRKSDVLGYRIPAV